MKQFVVGLEFDGDSVDYLSNKLDDPHNRGAFQLGNASLSFIV